MQPTNENSVGPIIAIVIVLAMIVLGGVYFLSERRNNDTDTKRTSMNSNADELTASITSQSSSNSTASIEEDLNNTNTDNLDSGLSNY